MVESADKGKARRGRPRGGPGGVPLSKKRDLQLEVRQVQLLDALIATAPIGTPTFTSLIRQAVNMFLDAKLAEPGVQTKVDKYLKAHRRVANLRDVNQDG
jgi:hypothetical protein